MVSAHVLRFGSFELDVRVGELRNNGTRVRLPEQSVQLLLMLLDHPGEVVSREDIRLRLWPNETIVDFDQSISAVARRLRRALGDSASSPRFVETLAKRGYRFLVEVERIGAPPASHYRLLEKIGEGGMGVVYRAEDLKLGRHVAVKFPPTHGSFPEEAVRSLEQEARAISALNHPNICTIYGLEYFDGKPGIVMELLSGETLAARLARGPLPVSEALAVAIATLCALADAHAAGIVHRDLKPANIILTRNGVKVLDFGLAARNAITGSTPPEMQRSVRDGEMPGTLFYMSPEQVQGKPVDARSDIFSLGLLLYEMLSGRRPFGGESVEALRTAILERPPAPLNDVPPALAGIVIRCLGKSIEDRWTSANELKDELERVWVVAPKTSPPHFSRRVVAMAAAGLVIVFSVGIGLLYGSWRSAETTPTIRPLTLARLTGTGDIRAMDISADGKFVAYVRNRAGLRSLWLKQPSVEGDVELLDCGEDRCGGITFSPDGSMLYITRKAPQSADGTLYRVPVLGGAPEPVFSGISGEPAFAPDGRRVAFVRTSRLAHGQDILFTRSLSGTEEKEVVRYPAPGIQHNTVVWTSDGGRLVFVAMGKLTSIPPTGGRAETAPDQNWSELEDIAPSPYAGPEVLLSGSRLGGPSRMQIFRVSLLQNAVRQLTFDANRYTQIRSTAHGDLLVLQEERPRSIQVVTKGIVHTLFDTERQNITGQWGVKWTPDGRILYTSKPLVNERSDLWVMNADGSDRRRVTHSPDNLYYADPAMSGSGNFVVATIWEPGDVANIWRLNFSDGAARRLTQGLQDFPPSLSPDGKWIVYKSVRQDRPLLMKVSSDGGPASPVTSSPCDYPNISPDGRLIACFGVLDKSKPAELLIVPFSGGPPAKVFPLPSTTKLDVQLVWTPDGSAVSFVNRVNGVSNVWNQPLAGHGAYQATHFVSQDIFHFDWSQDGRLVLSQGEDTTDAMLIRGLPHP